MSGAEQVPARNPAGGTSELAALDDPEFLAVCRRVREQREHTPSDEVSAELAAQFDAVNTEFIRRAGQAWQRAS